MDIGQTLYNIFGQRIYNLTNGLPSQYSPIEYLVYGAVFLGVAFFIVYPFLNKRGIKFDAKFAIAALPFILLASVIRVLGDMGVIKGSPFPWEWSYYFVTPGLYMLFTALPLLFIWASYKLGQKTKISFYKWLAGFGLLFSAPVALFEIMNFKAGAIAGFFGTIALILAAGFAVIFIVDFVSKRLSKKRFFSRGIYKMALFGQLVDACSTFVATTFFRCGEQHPVSGAFLNIFPFSFVLVKIALVLLVVYFVDREIEDDNMKNFIPFLLVWLGFGPGLRDLFTLGVGTCL
ncbi:MAG: DUF63 family protein [Candidatus ainarchaeum sp.]|nr:DUF63 family protein [Candidatus ainarchaeum sp.]